MFYQRKKVIVFLSNIAFIFTSIVPNSVTMGMDNLDTSASSSSSANLILQPNGNVNNNDSDSESDTLSNISDVQTVNDVSSSAKCCERCCSTCCNCFCDNFVLRHPCPAISLFLLLGAGIVYAMAQAIEN